VRKSGGSGGRGAGEGGAEDLHARMRAVSDQLERYEERHREATVAAGTLTDELDDVRLLLDIRRRKIVALELAVRGARHEPPEVAIGAAAGNAVKREDGLENGRATGPGRGGEAVEAAKVETGPEGAEAMDVVRGDAAARGVEAPGARGAAQVAAAEKLAAARLEELSAMLEEKRALAVEVHRLRAEVARRQAGVLCEKEITGSALYQTMEIALQHAKDRRRDVEAEAAAAAEERSAELREAAANLDRVKDDAERELEDARKLVDDLRRVADSAKVEKDKWVMTYEGRKMEANAAAELVEASERRAAVSECMREKLRATNEGLSKEVAALQARVTEAELRAAAGADAVDLVRARLALRPCSPWKGGRE
jgi:hypothetical protein